LNDIVTILTANQEAPKTGEAVTAVTRKPRFDPRGLSLVLRRSPRGTRIVGTDADLFAGRTLRWADGYPRSSKQCSSI
jgi:hypothetical protein